jgi:predicted ArsR family transcriptional regulator
VVLFSSVLMSNNGRVPTTSGRAVIHRALASESRQALLAVLRRHRRPLDAAEAAEAVGLQRNTARVHLDVLASAGLVTRRLEERSTPGRPRVLYEATRPPAIDSDRRPAEAGYQELARVLADQLTGVAGARSEAIRAGRRWAAALDARPLPQRSLSPGEAVLIATEILDNLGFEPEPDPTAEPDRILLHRCPFAEVARENRSVVCGIHLGMLRATFERLDTSLVVDGLDSFVTDDPLLCVVRLRNKDTAREKRSSR